MRSTALSRGITVAVAFFGASCTTLPSSVSNTPEIFVAGGTFEFEGHPTQISPFRLDKYEVSVTDYRRCVRRGVCPLPRRAPAPGCRYEVDGCRAKSVRRGCTYWMPGGSQYPVNCVSVADAATYCRWISKRLPTAKEWLFEAVGGEEDRLFPWGGQETTCKNVARSKRNGDFCFRNGFVRVDHPLDGESRNGAAHLAGSVSEWVLNPDASGYSVAGSNIYTQPGGDSIHAGGVDRVIEFARYPTGSSKLITVGFRCARSPE